MAALVTLIPMILRIVSALAAIWGMFDARQAIENSMAVGAVDVPSVLGALPSWSVAIATFGASFLKYNSGASGAWSELLAIQTLLSGATKSKGFKLSPTKITIPTEDHLIGLTVEVIPREVPATVPSGFKLVPEDPDGPRVVL